MAQVELKDVSKKFGSTQVVHGANLSISDNEFIVLVGPSGCGKSTILRMIAGLESISGGEIQINNQSVNQVAPKDRNVAMVFQNYALYPHMTVHGNMAFSLKMAKLPKTEIENKVREAADILELTPYLHRKPSELSGGQRQRISIARALLADPKVIILDEATSNLDTESETFIQKSLQSLMNHRTTFVIAHRLSTIQQADRILVIEEGEIVESGKHQDLLDKKGRYYDLYTYQSRI